MSARLRLSQKLGVLSAILALCACGKGEGVTGVGGGTPGFGGGESDATAWVNGGWTGTFQLNDDNEPDATTASATFNVTDEKIGEFEITLPERDGAKAKGKFQDFQGASLMMAVSESTISSIGNAGSNVTFDYDLIGSALKLHNERAIIRLVRGDGPQATQPKGDKPAPTDGLNGNWSCPDGNGHVWQVTFPSAESANIDIYDAAGARAPTWMKGTIAKDVRFDGLITIQSAELDKYSGLQLGAKRAGANSLVIERLDTGDSLSCTPG